MAEWSCCLALFAVSLQASLRLLQNYVTNSMRPMLPTASLELLTAFTVHQYSGVKEHDFCVTDTPSIDESWYQRFYGDGYYMTRFDSGPWLGMEETKGSGPFWLAVVRDAAPVLGHRTGKGIVNLRMMDLKARLRLVSGRYDTSCAVMVCAVMPL